MHYYEKNIQQRRKYMRLTEFSESNVEYTLHKDKCHWVCETFPIKISSGSVKIMDKLLKSSQWK